MPPLLSDNEEGSGSDVGAPAPAKKKTSREKESVAYRDADPEDDDDIVAPPKINGKAAVEEDEEPEEEEEEEEELEEEEYVVEKILSHMMDKKGEPLFEVKWEGYDNPKDRTWEPEDNLRENASVVLEEYFERIGGREKLFEDTAKALKSKKRGRPSVGTPSSGGGGKRAKKNSDQTSTPADTPPPASAVIAKWKPPAGSWEDHIASLDACEDEDTGRLMVYLTWKNGQKTQHETSVIYARCPQKMLQFYERHIRIVKSKDVDSV
ncbi:hypothetical protein QBC46DRAFT_388748 [Diplogelasinospora grovesii]|uniref:Chromo domain-containing protein n=1 Tax=Diplogelasinospora grovesii TaxID=303347 RepID=A0AAN6N6E6_9PEZI|nr:hypothetical protein QBC46DRAFT_388748 [Diplogelasinospora grovesii]